MPCIDDWLSDPLSIVQAIYGETGQACPKKVKDYFMKRLDNDESVARVPSLNDVPLHYLKPNSLVRYRCMIQDMHNPEYFAGVYQTMDKATGQKFSRSALFTDVAQCPADHELNFESHDVILNRSILYCVPIPGEMTWVKKAYSKTSLNHPKSVPGPSNTNSNKRSIEEDDVAMATDDDCHLDEKAACSEGDDSNKRSRQSKDPSESSLINVTKPDLNFPLPEEKGPACIVKVYDDNEQYKVTDMVEFIGILSIDPALATFHSSSDNHDSMELDEAAAHSPPPSLVPRLHCILAKTLAHSNPLVPANLSDEDKGTRLQVVSSVRQDLLKLLTQILGGDNIAAEYLLLHLISTVYSRVDVMALGKFSLNLQLPSEMTASFPQKMFQLLQDIVPKAHMLPISLSNMNKLNLVPKKDCAADRVVSGILQLTDGTHLVLDETALKAGKLEEKGVCNVQALNDLLLWQKIQYDFTYHKTDFVTNLIVLILSEGKSLLQSDCQIRVQCQYIPQLPESLPEELLLKIRMYLGLARISPYTLSSDMQKLLEDDFVNARQEDKKNMSADLFHSLLVTARLLSLSLGQTELSPQVWNKARQLEQARNQRLAS